MFRIATLLTLLFIGTTGFAQQSAAQQPAGAMETHAVRLGRTRALVELAPLPATRAASKAKVRAKRPPRNFVGRGFDFPVNPTAKPQGPDPTRQGTVAKTTTFPTVWNRDGIEAGSSPHDPTGDVGRDFYVQAVNVTNFQIFDKTDGTPVTGVVAANTLWQEVNRSSAGDPIVMYDQTAERWIITEFPPGNELLFAISETGDPRGSYDVYVFSTPFFPDYPKYSVWDNAYVVTTNETGVGQHTNYFINRDSMLAGAAEVPIQRILLPGYEDGPGFFVTTPVDWTGMAAPAVAARPMVLRQNDDAWGNVDKDQIELITFDLDWTDADSTTFTVTPLVTAPFDTDPCSVPGFGFSCAPQLDGGGIDAVPAVIMNRVQYRNYGPHESIVLSFITDVTGGDNLSGIRWMELRRPGADGEWSVYQEGTFAPEDGLDRYMPSISQDGEGNISIAYSASSEDQYVSLYFTGRRSGDPLGQMTIPETQLVAGSAPIFGSRYCDYAQMTVDPFNDRVFYFTSEYPNGTNNVTSRIAAWNLTKDTVDIAASALVTPQDLVANRPAAETVTMQVRNTGVETQTSFNVGYIVEDLPPVVETVDFVLAPDSVYTHVFDIPVRMDTIGDYDFKLFTDLTGDAARFNDTLEVTLTTLPAFDAGVSAIGGVAATVCSDTVALTLTLENFSGVTLTSVDFALSLNGQEPIIVNRAGNLEPLQSTEVAYVLRDLADAFYTLTVTTANPNGGADQVVVNDDSQVNFSVLSDGETVTLELFLDDYPEETSWELRDDAGNVLFSGGTYPGEFFTVISESFCLDPAGCYEFVQFDSFGDGIFLNGNAFELTNAAGVIIASAGTAFGGSTSADFCLREQCLLEVEVMTSPETVPGASDGAIRLDLSNTGTFVFQLSIDGGQTFVSADESFLGDLPTGEYEVVVTNGTGCEYRETVTVSACALSATVTVIDSVLTVMVDGGDGPFEYSIDGDDFQDDNVFGDVGPGTYTVTVRSAEGCSVTVEDVRVDFTSDVTTTVYGTRVTVFPNPTDGVFRLAIEGLDARAVFLPVELYDANGRLIYTSQLTRYDADYYGYFSLVTRPAGVYYLRVVDEQMTQLLRVVKR